ITKENVELKAKVKHLEGVHGTLDAINRAVKEREVKKELEQKIDAVEAKADEVKAIAKAVTETKTPISEETKTEEKPAEEAPVEEKKDEN
ncbi:hypothetical protein, partial [Oceanihabitans sediminis]|uniref:hypothetical protein n=1 Tax=Oceanihabitans sediminis TaxID=1812012 RepID=UPI00299F08F8